MFDETSSHPLTSRKQLTGRTKGGSVGVGLGVAVGVGVGVGSCVSGSVGVGVGSGVGVAVGVGIGENALVNEFDTINYADVNVISVLGGIWKRTRVIVYGEKE